MNPDDKGDRNEPPTASPASVNRPHAGHVITFTMGEVSDRHYLGFPLQRSLMAVEITAACKLDIIPPHQLSAFTINLDVAKDIAYHFDVRPNQGRIAQNTCISGGWGSGGWLAIPAEFVSGQLFTLRIAVEQDIVVSLNGRVLDRYAHRLPPAQIDAVHIVYVPGSLQVQSVKVFEPMDSEIRPPDVDVPDLPDSNEVPHLQRSQPERPSDIQIADDSQTAASFQEPSTIIATTDIPQLLSDLPPEFEPLRSLLEANLLPYLKMIPESAGHLNSAGYPISDWSGDPLELWQSKIGGHPYLPKGTSYPIDRETGEQMMFLMQVNCADLPSIDGFALPRQGILQFYVGLDVAMCELSPEQHRILYFPEVSQDKNNLVTDFSFLARTSSHLEWYDDVYALRFSLQQDVFWVARQSLNEPFDIPEDLTALCKEFNEWMSDYDLDNDFVDRRISKLGGYVELHSYVDETIEGAKGRLLLELQHPFASDDHFYFFIEDSDLINSDFSKVESYFLRY